MTHKYLEIQEEEYDEQTEVPNTIRINDVTDEEAESLFAEHKDKFKKPKAHVVEGHHDKDSKKNIPCKSRKFDSEGKLNK